MGDDTTDGRDGREHPNEDGERSSEPGDRASDAPERRVVTEGQFEREVEISRADAASFLRDLADQLDEGGDLTVAYGDWEVPFSFSGPVELEVEVEDGDERELEIELEFEA